VPLITDDPSVRAHAPQVPEPFHRNGWVYEEKVDGWRMLAYKDGGRVRLVSRTGVEHSKRFGGVAEAIGALSFPVLVLDGEIAQALAVRFASPTRGREFQGPPVGRAS
jgi:ATP-dependent DNA ligase